MNLVIGLPARRSADLFQRVETALEWPLMILALAVVPALILEDRATSDGVRAIALGLNWTVWLAFCAEFLTLLWLAPDRLAYATRAWFNLAIIVLSPPFLAPEAFQAARGLRAVRLLRLVRLIRAGAIAGRRYTTCQNQSSSRGPRLSSASIFRVTRAGSAGLRFRHDPSPRGGKICA